MLEELAIMDCSWMRVLIADTRAFAWPVSGAVDPDDNLVEDVETISTSIRWPPYHQTRVNAMIHGL
jgi:hypothetical protein